MLIPLIIMFAEADAGGASPITVTASREPVAVDLSGSAVTIIDQATIDALALPLVKDYLTLSPSVAVAQSGPMGAQTQVRIRGAEANHTLTFIDGIDVSDPGSSGEFRYETLLADGVARIEVLRGPQSALWGSEAVGGVVNILTRSDTGLYGEAEGGSLGTFRAGAGGGLALGSATTASGQVSYLGSRGYDISHSGGDKDGYENFTIHGKIVSKPTDNTNLSLVARYSNSNSEFDDFDYTTGVPIDAPLATRTRQLALRGSAGITLLNGHWANEASVFYTDAANINRTAGVFQNRSDGDRYTLRYQTSLTAATGSLHHRLTAAIEHQRESFDNIDADPTALSNQVQSRLQTSVVGEYRLDAGDWLGGGLAVRHDWNNRFADSTTVRATAAVKPGAGFTLHGSYGSGVSDPTFYDLFGYYPGYFIGNPGLKPERSQGWDLGGGWASHGVALDITWFHSNLVDEIISTYDPATFLSGTANALGRSERQGLEATASARIASGLTLAATYAYLDATQQQVAGSLAVREVRRPPHSGSITASYTSTRFDVAASAAITGARDDTDFANNATVRLAPYTLLTVSGAWHVNRHFDLTGRIENALDQQYQDVFAYRNPGLTLHAGVRLRL